MKNRYIFNILRSIKHANEERYLDFFDNRKNIFVFREPKGLLNKDKVIYDIDLKGDNSGFFAIYRWLLSALYVADRFNFVPFIEISETLYNNRENFREDIFEKYFEQPFDLTRSIVDESANVVEFIQYDHLRWFQNEYGDPNDLLCGYKVNEEYLCKSAEIKKKYIRLKSDVEKKIRDDIDSLHLDERTVAVHYRGTDYKAGFKNHPIGLEPEDYFEDIDKCLKEGYTKIFVATDDKTGLDIFVERYKDLVTYYKDTRRSDDGKSVHEFEGSRENDAYLKGYEVLRDMLTLSNCDALICGKSQVSFASVIEKKANNSEFEYYKVLDKGTYTKDERKKYYKENKR